jgi:hypothetical protein
MRLLSCDACGVILDGDKFKFPEIWDCDGEYVEGASQWSGEAGRMVPIAKCPVCGHILEDLT